MNKPFELGKKYIPTKTPSTNIYECKYIGQKAATLEDANGGMLVVPLVCSWVTEFKEPVIEKKLRSVSLGSQWADGFAVLSRAFNAHKTLEFTFTDGELTSVEIVND